VIAKSSREAPIARLASNSDSLSHFGQPKKNPNRSVMPALDAAKKKA
jgi:hypothetical protein